MWIKKGLIYKCDLLGTGYAQDAFIDKLDENVWRIYYSARTREVISLPFYIDVEAGNPQNILFIHKEPLFLPGSIGSFDETGITMTSIVKKDNYKYLYYCGWNRRFTSPYALSIGVVKVSEENKKYEKIYNGPILDRSKFDPISVSAPMVIYDEGIFKMWYISFTKWEKVYNKLEPIFVIKYATSNDGINWETSPDICIDSSYEGESLARPWVIKDQDKYKMWFSSRGSLGYRTPDGQHYMIEYAESSDGKKWDRIKSYNNLILSDSGWDSEMLAYASVTKHNNKLLMLYNGNDFGKTGFGYAILDTEK